MRGSALRVPRARGEESRRALMESGGLRRDLAIRSDGESLLLPIVDAASVPNGLGEIVEADFEPITADGPSDYRELLTAWPPDEAARLPRSFDVVGDVVLVRLPPELRPRAREIGEALRRFVPGARIVGADHGVKGTARRRELEALAGSGGWRTRHRENGIEIEVDLERAYFSPRLAREHARVAAEVARDDRVYDLCCGVGPFALTIARDGRAERIVAVDSNPEAIALLRASLAREPFGSRIDPVDADVGAFVARAPPADRVILNLPHEGIKYLPSVARTVARRGRLYYYEVTLRTDGQRRAEAVVATLDRPREWVLADQHVVHPYSPAADLLAFVWERASGG